MDGNKERKRRNACLLSLILLCLLTIPLYADGAGKKEKTIKTKMIDLVRVKAGSGPDSVGVATPPEANAEGPMSFAVGTNGEVSILDQVNRRIQIFKNGKRIRTIPIPGDTFIDMDLTPDGNIVLLDNTVKKSVYLIDANGRKLNILPLEGGQVPYAPSVTEIQVVPGGKHPGIWVCVGDASVRIASLDGKTSDRIRVPGKFSLNGRRLLRASKIGDATAAVHRSKEDRLDEWEPERTIFFDRYIDHLLGPWTDTNGNIYLGAFLTDNAEGSNVVVVLTPEGKEWGRVELFVQKTPHEIQRSIRVSPDGHILQMSLDDPGLFVRRYEPVGER